MHWAKFAADSDLTEGISLLGYFYLHGVGTECDEVLALHYLEIAATRSDGAALMNLGSWDEEKGKLKKALAYYERADKAGFPDASSEVQHIQSVIARKEKRRAAANQQGEKKASPA